jgi:hypothetical protein
MENANVENGTITENAPTEENKIPKTDEWQAEGTIVSNAEFKEELSSLMAGFSEIKKAVADLKQEATRPSTKVIATILVGTDMMDSVAKKEKDNKYKNNHPEDNLFLSELEDLKEMVAGMTMQMHEMQRAQTNKFAQMNHHDEIGTTRRCGSSHPQKNIISSDI